MRFLVDQVFLIANYDPKHALEVFHTSIHSPLPLQQNSLSDSKSPPKSDSKRLTPTLPQVWIEKKPSSLDILQYLECEILLLHHTSQQALAQRSIREFMHVRPVQTIPKELRWFLRNSHTSDASAPIRILLVGDQDECAIQKSIIASALAPSAYWIESCRDVDVHSWIHSNWLPEWIWFYQSKSYEKYYDSIPVKSSTKSEHLNEHLNEHIIIWRGLQDIPLYVYYFFHLYQHDLDLPRLLQYQNETSKEEKNIQRILYRRVYDAKRKEFQQLYQNLSSESNQSDTSKDDNDSKKNVKNISFYHVVFQTKSYPLDCQVLMLEMMVATLEEHSIGLDFDGDLDLIIRQQIMLPHFALHFTPLTSFIQNSGTWFFRAVENIILEAQRRWELRSKSILQSYSLQPQLLSIYDPVVDTDTIEGKDEKGGKGEKDKKDKNTNNERESKRDHAKSQFQSEFSIRFSCLPVIDPKSQPKQETSLSASSTPFPLRATQAWSNKDAERVCLVTGMFGIRVHEEKERNKANKNTNTNTTNKISSVKSPRDYIQLAQSLLKWNSCFMIIFTEPTYAHEIWSIRFKLGLAHKTLVFPMCMEQSELYGSVSLLKSLYYEKRIPHGFCPQKDTALYVFSQATKYDCLQKALALNPQVRFHTTHMFWIDFGIYHVVLPPISVDRLLQQLGRSQRIRITHLRNLNPNEIKNKVQFWSKLQQAAAGGLVGGPNVDVAWLCQAFIHEFTESLAHYPVLDEAILGSLCLQYPARFFPILSCHSEMFSLRSPVHIFFMIHQFQNQGDWDSVWDCLLELPSGKDSQSLSPANQIWQADMILECMNNPNAPNNTNSVSSPDKMQSSRSCLPTRDRKEECRAAINILCSFKDNAELEGQKRLQRWTKHTTLGKILSIFKPNL